ncbi:MAG: hypothetical protein RJQ04_17100 [Longimicrobiales bacterium]
MARAAGRFGWTLGLVLTVGCGGAPDEGEAPATTAPTDGPDIWVAALTTTADGHFEVGDPVNVTARAGYDNQPHFLPDGSGFWYTRDDGSQADIWYWDAASGQVSAVTATAPESEYSATPLPDGSGFSAIRVEADSAQRLWRFDADGSNPAVLIPDLAPVGYQAWSGPSTLVLFVLGDPATLQVVDVATGAARVVAEDVGRTVHPIPGGPHVSFVQRVEGGTEIRRLDPSTGETTLIAPGLGGGDFYAWTPDGVLLQADGGILMEWRSDHPMWMPVADFTGLGLTLSRLAVAPDGSRIALVAEGGPD